MSAFHSPQPRPGFIDARGDFPCCAIVTTLDHRRPASPRMFVQLEDGALHLVTVPELQGSQP